MAIGVVLFVAILREIRFRHISPAKAMLFGQISTFTVVALRPMFAGGDNLVPLLDGAAAIILVRRHAVGQVDVAVVGVAMVRHIRIR